jgi:hypothetical protein
VELAFVFLIVVVGVGAILYAGMRKPGAKSKDSRSGDTGPIISNRNDDTADGGDGGGD